LIFFIDQIIFIIKKWGGFGNKKPEIKLHIFSVMIIYFIWNILLKEGEFGTILHSEIC